MYRILKPHGRLVMSDPICEQEMNETLKNDEKLAKKIEKELNSENGAIDFAKMTDFDWDSLIILGPYTTIENIEKEFDLKLANIRQNGIHYSDYYDLVVFIKGKKSVKIVELKRAINSQRKIIKKEDQRVSSDDYANGYYNINGTMLRLPNGWSLPLAIYITADKKLAIGNEAGNRGSSDSHASSS